MSNIPHERIGEFIKQALVVLQKNGGSLPSKEVLNLVSERIHPNAYELERFEKTGYVRWESYLQFYSINMKKAGWLRKQKGYWFITPEGEQVTALTPLDVLHKARTAYKEWQKTHPKELTTEETEEPTEDATRSITLEQSESDAAIGIEEYIHNLNAYDFQDLVAALLRAMGFHIPFVAPKGKDGGVDIVAYKDPLGAQPPRIKVQVKHRQEKCGPQAVRELLGLIRKEGEVGLIVSSGGFTNDALIEIQKSWLIGKK